ncbi:FAD-binding domain-containing protein [Daldinia decipiens]|uniref:FAD-binding domain-containing protein n=1 Tax=Daldinia decipiens TaxID=326647 RepID=UPI0020C47379|nr:FAD-binding domain-containing protein [Daldinia decipiens]KAI1657942.1 FAD-binding domain-containing protein [Daldinia decipiens]
MSLSSASLLTLCFLTPFVFSTSIEWNSNLACQILASKINNRVFFPGGAEYNASVFSYAYVQQQILKPSCIVKPSDSAEVATTLKALRRSPATQFAIRSGGHGTNGGFSNIDSGVTVDMTSIHGVDILEDGITASIGTGALWGDVYAVLDTHNRSLNGGRASGVGIGGFLSGGGIGFFALQYGFGCDAVVNMEVVLSSGDIINANATSNPALFKALKGGQNNFGVVTRWDITTISKGEFWGGSIVYPNSTTAKQLEAFTHWKTPENFDPSSSVEQSHVYIEPLQTFLVSNSIFYTKPREFPLNLKNYTDIQPQISSTLRISNATDFSYEVQSFSTPNQSSIYATTTFRMCPTIIKKVHAIWKAYAEKLPHNATITSSLTLQSIPPPATDPTKLNSLGFDPASTPQKDLVLVLISNFWENPEAGAQVRGSAADFINDVDRIAEEEGVAHKFRYMNYADADFQQPLHTTGQLDDLRKVALEYDAIGMFQRQVTGGWKLYP